MTTYLVTGRWRYLEFEPGSTFEASLPSDQEARAIESGVLRVIQASPVSLQPGTVRLADGWATRHKED